MEMSYAIGRYEQAAELLPARWQQAARRVPDFRKAQAEEFRLRAGRPMTLVTTEGELFVSDELPRQSVTQSDLEQLCDTVTGYSRYAASESMGKGYLVGRGGFRVGLCGTVVLRDGVGVNLRDISSASVRGRSSGIIARIMMLTERSLMRFTISSKSFTLSSLKISRGSFCS